jgi:hypothetical protein
MFMDTLGLKVKLFVMRNDYPEREYSQAAGNGEPLEIG